MVYTPLGLPGSRLVAILSFANAALPYVLTAYLALYFANFFSAVVSHIFRCS